jgi:putative oxidoreductase
MTVTTSPRLHPVTAERERGSAKLLHRLIATDRSTASFVLRLTLALVMFPHGAQKVFGWFGGDGFSGTLGFFTGTLGVPALFAILVFAAELLGPIGLAVGAFSRVAAAGLIAVMTGAIFMAHLPHGFFMNWTGAQAGEGFEFHLLVIGMSIALVIAGSGRWSFDRWLAAKV